MKKKIFRNSISLTAWIVIACQLLLKRSERWKILPRDEDADFYDACSEYYRKHSLLCRLLDILPDKLKLWLLERALARGAAQHFVLRKQAIAQQVDAAIKSGVTQLVVIGGGFDPLAINIARRHPSIQCFEIDTPAMHAHKIAIASAFHGTLPGNFHGIGAHLSQVALYDTLSSRTAFHSDRPTLFIAEGVTMYLRQDDILRMFADMRRLCTAPAAILFTVIELHREMGNGWAKRLRDLVLSSNNEQFSWSLPQKDMLDFLTRQGFGEQYHMAYADLQSPWRDEREMAILREENGEYLVYAQMLTA